MKKTLTVFASLLALSAFAGCSNSSTVTSEPQEVLSSSSSDGAVSDVSSSDSESASEDVFSPVAPQDGYPNTRAGDYVRAALSYGEWGGMEPLPEDAFEFVIPGFDKSWADDYCFANTMISANLFKVYVIKPADGCKDSVKQWLSDHLDYCRESAAFYPQQQKQAAGAVVGETDDEYCYLICHEEGADVADHMTAAL